MTNRHHTTPWNRKAIKYNKYNPIYTFRKRLVTFQYSFAFYSHLCINTTISILFLQKLLERTANVFPLISAKRNLWCVNIATLPTHPSLLDYTYERIKVVQFSVNQGNSSWIQSIYGSVSNHWIYGQSPFYKMSLDVDQMEGVAAKII